MNKTEFYELLDETFELDTGTITGKELLSDNELIDSISMLGLISLLDKKFGFQLDPGEILKLGSVEDLFVAVKNSNDNL